MQKEKYLIINIDDFGVSHAANIAARELYKTGKVTSMSIMAGTSAYDEAVNIIKDDNIESVGVHLYVTNEYPGSENTFALKGLTDCGEIRSNDAFTENFEYSAKVNDIVFKEASAQLEKVISDGIHPSHIDNHMYRLWPTDCNDFFESACKLCKEHGIGAIRLSTGFSEIPTYYGVYHMTRIERMCAKATAQKYKVRTVDNVYLMTQGKDESFDNKIMLNRFKEFLVSLPDGVSEMHFHPAVEDEVLKKNNPWWRERVAEYELFKNNDMRSICKEYGIKLISYKDLAQMKYEKSKIIFPGVISKILKKLDFIKF